MAEQNFKNHGRYVPLYHFFALPILLVNVGVQLYRLIAYRLITPLFALLGLFSVLFAAALFLAALYGRLFALAVQDRLIRLEEQLRFARLLPADLQPRIGEFTAGQMVALRFASDAELPALARKVLDEKLTERKAIKQQIKNWRADYFRA
jgi:uncharacterized membrane protein YciS (DUF1049 family)